MKTKKVWEWGSISQVAKDVGISRQWLHNILAGRRSCPADLAERLVSACATYGYSTAVFDWLFPQTSENPLMKAYQ